MMLIAIRPYRAAFAARFQLMLQYRAAAFAGVATQCWWGGLKAMILAAFYGSSTLVAAPLTLSEAITYTWLAQACFAMTPWTPDPDVALAMRTGSVSHDRLRPVDTYALWYAQAAGWIASRAMPRAGLMLLFAGIALPVLGLEAWAWRMPPNGTAALLFSLSIVLALLLSAAVTMLLNIVVVATLNDRGINTLAVPLMIVFTGSLLPLPLFPDWLQTALLVQPLAGLMDIPFRIYFGRLSGTSALAGLSLQVFWITSLVAMGRIGMTRTFRRLEVQGG